MMRYLPAMAAAALLASAAGPVCAQWTNQYPRVEGYGHHVYLEQEHLPILSSGPVYPAAAPDGKRLAFAHQGWIWVLDLDSRIARRITDGAAVDGRPRWSPMARAWPSCATPAPIRTWWCSASPTVLR